MHDILAPLTPSGGLNRLDVVGDTVFVVTMQELFGVVFECPSSAPVAHVSWNLDTLRLDRSFQILWHLSTVRTTVEKLFPSSLVYVHRPKDPDSQLMVECRAALADGSFWHGSWPMNPVSEIRVPVFLERDDVGAVSRVQVRLSDSAGTVFDGVPLVVSNTETRYRVNVESGQAMLLPHGDYKVRPLSMPKWLFDVFFDLRMEVSESTPEVFDVALSEPLVELELKPLFGSAGPLAPLHIKLKHETRGSLVIANWRPSRGPIRELFPAGNITISVNSQAYEYVALSRNLSSNGERVAIEIPLRERGSERR